MKDTQAAQFASFAPVLPLVFISGTIVPVGSMPDWLQAFARNQPVTITINAVRGLMLGGPAAPWVWQSLLWCAGLLAVFVSLSVRLYRRSAA